MTDMVEKLDGRVKDIEVVLWKGNGRAGLVTRVEIGEKRMDSMESSQGRWERIALKLALSAVGALLTVAGRILWETVKR